MLRRLAFAALVALCPAIAAAQQSGGGGGGSSGSGALPAAPQFSLQYNAGSNAFGGLSFCTTTQALLGGGTGALPVCGQINLGSMITGNLPVGNLNNGTNATASTFWRGDGTWASPAGSGNVSTSGSITNNTLAVWNSGTTVTGTLAYSATPAPNTIAETGGANTLATGFIPAINLATGGAGGVTGSLPVTNLNNGSGATSSTFWRGDGTWATPAGGGNVSTSGTITNGTLPVWISSTQVSGTQAYGTTAAANTVPETGGGGTLASGFIPAVNLAAGGAGGVTGNLPVTNLNGGTGASNTTFWRGDGTWSAAGAANAGTAGQGAYYATNGSTVSGSNGLTLSGSAITGAVMGLGSDAAGDVYYNNGSALARLAKGANGQVLTLASGLPSWATPSVTIGTTTISGGSSGQLLYNSSSTVGSETLSAAMDSAFGSSQGSVVYRGSSGWAGLAPGINGQFLESLGPSANIQWASPSGSGTVNAGSAGQATYYASTGSAVSANTNWSYASSFLGGNYNSASIPTPGATNYGTQVQGADGSNSGYRAYAYQNGNSVTAAMTVLTAAGTGASPSAITSGSQMGGYYFGGYNSSSWANGAAIAGFATQTWTTSAEGTQLGFYTTPNGSTTNAENALLDQNGALLLPATEPNPGANGMHVLGPAGFDNTLTLSSPGGGTQNRCLGMTSTNLVVPSNQPCNSLSFSIGWVPGLAPQHAIIVADLPFAITVGSIVGRLEANEGSAGTVNVYSAPNGTACASGTNLTNTTSFNTNGSAPNNQALAGTTTAVPAGSSLCLVTTGTFNNSEATITVNATPS